MKKNIAKLGAFCAAIVLSVGAFAQAPPAPDWSAMTTAISGDIQTAVVTIVPLLGGLLALFIGVRVMVRYIRKFSAG